MRSTVRAAFVGFTAPLEGRLRHTPAVRAFEPIDVAANAVDHGCPRPVAGSRPGPADAGVDTVDAAVNRGASNAYLFRGDAYVPHDIAADRVDDGYPRSIAGDRRGLAETGMAGPSDATWLE